MPSRVSIRGSDERCSRCSRSTGLVKHFTVGQGVAGGGRVVHAVDGVSFSIAPGEVLGLVGESGSGKTTVGYCVNRLYEPTDGTIRLDGADITHLSRRSLRPHRRRMHIVFQDPYSSLNPRMTCAQIVGEPIRLHRLARALRDRPGASSSSSTPSGSARSCASATRTSSPAVSASASAWPGRSASTRAC